MSDSVSDSAPRPGAVLRARWQQQADGRESIVLPTDLPHPPIRATRESLTRHFARDLEPVPLRNPHHENKVTEEQRRGAKPAAVLIPIVARGESLSVVVTERHESISFGGHLVFPGGHRDPADRSAWDNALREANEEIGLPASDVTRMGRLGDYVTHSGFRISPFVGLVEAPTRFVPNPGEVEAIFELPLDFVLRSDSYELRGWKGSSHRHYLLRYGEAYVAGPTVSMLIGLYESLLETHEPLE